MALNTDSVLIDNYDNEYTGLCNKYNLPNDGRTINFTELVWKYFENLVNK